MDAGVFCSNRPLPAPPHTPLPEHNMRPTLRAAARIRASTDRQHQRQLQPSPGGVEDCQRNTTTAAQAQVPELSSLDMALDALEDAIADLEFRRPLLDEARLNRMTRLRLRLRRVAGKSDEQPTSACVNPDAVPLSGSFHEGSQKTSADQVASGYGISPNLASRLSPEMLQELRKNGPPQKHRSLEEDRRDFEERRRQATYDPLENDPLEIHLRKKREQYMPPGVKPAPLMEPKPHETLRKPPIQNLINRKPPHWKDAYAARYEYTMEQIRLGLAPEGIERTLGPGPWDHDPAFWGGRSAGDGDRVLEHEMDEDIVFD